MELKKKNARIILITICIDRTKSLSFCTSKAIIKLINIQRKNRLHLIDFFEKLLCIVWKIVKNDFQEESSTSINCGKVVSHLLLIKYHFQLFYLQHISNYVGIILFEYLSTFFFLLFFYRVTELSRWRNDLENLTQQLLLELCSLNDEKSNTEREIENMSNLLQVVSECISTRDRRRKTELTYDETDIQLKKELCMTANIQDALTKR